MPELFRFFGFLFYFYSREHEPIHVHVEGAGGLAIFDYNAQSDSFVARYEEYQKQRSQAHQCCD